MAQLDVIVINADTFEKAALVQIVGRVDVNKKPHRNGIISS